MKLENCSNFAIEDTRSKKRDDEATEYQICFGILTRISDASMRIKIDPFGMFLA